MIRWWCVRDRDAVSLWRSPLIPYTVPCIFPLLFHWNLLAHELNHHYYHRQQPIDFNVYHNLLHHPKINHEWFKVGLASSIAILGLKGYVELYQGKKHNKAVEYENFKSATHWTIFLILVSWISFHMALSPVYGLVKTWLIMIGFGYGVLIQSALMIPVWGQNILAFVLMTFFLQMYQ